MDKDIKEILKLIEDNGYEAFVVGGYTRDFLLDKKTYDVDICTNAHPKTIKQIFNKNNIKEQYGCISFKYNKYNIDITTYRKELKYLNRKPIKIKFIKKLNQDLKRRDFTINTICMDYLDNFIDIYNGIDDLNNKLIKSVGNPDKKLKEDPLRILRAIRFSLVLNFHIDKKLEKSIINNYKLVSNLSQFRLKEEISIILKYEKGLKYLKKYKINDIIDLQKYK